MLASWSTVVAVRRLEGCGVGQGEVRVWPASSHGVLDSGGAWEGFGLMGCSSWASEVGIVVVMVVDMVVVVVVVGAMA